MLILFLCLFFCGIVNGAPSVRCGIGDGSTFLATEDGVAGRYQLQWCTVVDQSMGQFAKWIVSVHYNTKPKAEDCPQNRPEWSRWDKHSHFEEEVSIDLNCTNVCLSADLDLIFSGTCYAIKTHLEVMHKPNEVHRIGARDYLYYVNNNCSKESFSNSQPYFKIYPSGDHVIAYWYLNKIPINNFTMLLCPVVEPYMIEECVNVTGNCSVTSRERTQLQCALWPPRARYRLQLTHAAPWTSGLPLFENITTVVLPADRSVPNSPSEPLVVPAGARSVPWWALGGVLALAAGGLLALLACRERLLRKLSDRVHADWRTRRQLEAVAKPEGGKGGRILLLYARDCAAMMEVAAQLRKLLQGCADHVYDLYRPETVVAAAGAPAEWLRRLMARADLRVVLLQSPAALALHAADLRARGADRRLVLEQPLLGRRAVLRAPHAADQLLPLALRLLADTAHTTHSYKKFYIATIAGLEAELVREVTPLRRYILPAAAPLLLRDLCDGAIPVPTQLASTPVPAPLAPAPNPVQLTPAPLAPLEGQFQELTDAVRALHEHVRANPDYLDDELIFFDYE